MALINKLFVLFVMSYTGMETGSKFGIAFSAHVFSRCARSVVIMMKRTPPFRMLFDLRILTFQFRCLNKAVIIRVKIIEAGNTTVGLL